MLPCAQYARRPNRDPHITKLCACVLYTYMPACMCACKTTANIGVATRECVPVIVYEMCDYVIGVWASSEFRKARKRSLYTYSMCMCVCVLIIRFCMCIVWASACLLWICKCGWMGECVSVAVYWQMHTRKCLYICHICARDVGVWTRAMWRDVNGSDLRKTYRKVHAQLNNSVKWFLAFENTLVINVGIYVCFELGKSHIGRIRTLRNEPTFKRSW